jgi:hypothetical protein
MTDNTLHIHETVFDDAAFDIVCNLLNRQLIADDKETMDKVESVIKQTLRHQLYLQRNWDEYFEYYEGLASKQLWSRPVQPT